MLEQHPCAGVVGFEAGGDLVPIGVNVVVAAQSRNAEDGRDGAAPALGHRRDLMHRIPLRRIALRPQQWASRGPYQRLERLAVEIAGGG